MKKTTILLALLFSALSVTGAFGEPIANSEEEPTDSPAPSATVGIPTEDGYSLIDTAGLKQLLDTEPAGIVVVDARNPEEYQEVHIKGAINVPQKKLDEYVHLLPEDKSIRIIFYCNGVKCGKSHPDNQPTATDLTRPSSSPTDHAAQSRFAYFYVRAEWVSFREQRRVRFSERRGLVELAA